MPKYLEILIQGQPSIYFPIGDHDVSWCRSHTNSSGVIATSHIVASRITKLLLSFRQILQFCLIHKEWSPPGNWPAAHRSLHSSIGQWASTWAVRHTTITQRAAWIFNPRCVGKVDIDLCLRYHHCWISDGACSQCGHSGSRCCSIRIHERGVIRVLELRHDGRTLAHANCNAWVLEVLWRCRMARKVSLFHRDVWGAQPLVAAAKIACTMRRTLALTPASARASSRNIWLSVSNDCSTVINEGYYCLPAFPKNHLYKPPKGADVVPATPCRSETGLCMGRKSVKCFEQSSGLDTALYKNLHF